MTKEQKKKMLTLDYKLDPANDFFVVEDDAHGPKIILKRTGIDKIEAQIRMNFTIEDMQVVPYGNKVSVTILGRGVDSDGVVARTVAMANPDNCAYDHYAETAESRCRHRLLLKLAHLYEHHIFSQIESPKWMETRNEYIGAVQEVNRLLNLNDTKTIQKQPRPRSPRSADGSNGVQQQV